MRINIFLSVVAMLVIASVASAQSPGRRTNWTGAYTTAPAARVEEVYKANCARCHGEDLSRNPQAILNGNDFLQRWREDTVDGLFTFVKTSMPPGRRGSARVPLEDKQYLDVITYIFKANDFPAGD